MLDNGTKKRIDSARDILVGKVPDPKSQVEQITIAMIYKFMDDMDNQTEELGGKVCMAAERIVQLKESGIECSIDQHTINIRIGPAKEKGAKPDYGNFAGHHSICF